MKKILITLTLLVDAFFLILCMSMPTADEPSTVKEIASAAPVISAPDPVTSTEGVPERPPDTLQHTRAEQLAPATVSDLSVQIPMEEVPQGEPVLEVPADQVLDDPRAYGGVIIPRSNSGIYVPGLKAEMVISSSDKSGQLTPNQTGAFPTVVIIPNGKAEITLTYPELGQGTEVKLYCPDGGTIDGEPSTTRSLSGSGALSFEWEGNDNLGRHTIHCVAGSEEDLKVISFWVGPRAYADASALPRS